MKAYFFRIPAVLVLLLLGTYVLAQEPPPQDPPKQEEKDKKKKKEDEQKKKDENQDATPAESPMAGARSMGPVYEVPYREVAQGSTVPIRLTAEQCQGQTLLAFGKAWRCGTDNLLVLGVDMRTEPNMYPVVLRDDPAGKPVAGVKVLPAEFKRERRRPPVVRTDPKVRPAERTRIGAALESGPGDYAGVTLTGPFAYPLREPAWSASKVTDIFGAIRVYGKEWTDQHKGQDREAASGTPVISIGNGIVVLAERFSSEGGLLIIYHGQGVYSLYQHLDAFAVGGKGALVHTGEVVAASGATGNVTGPHLHWAVYINGAVVDPESFCQTMNGALYARKEP